MTDFFPFSPSNVTAPSFIITLDNSQYKITVIWNVSSQRYFVMCETLDGNLIFYVPLIESSTALQVTSMHWDEQNFRVVGKTIIPHSLNPGQLVFASIINALPNTYNGSGFINILSRDEFFYPLSPNPGLNLYPGAIQILNSIASGYFNSTLVFRNGRFEVSP